MKPARLPDGWYTCTHPGGWPEHFRPELGPRIGYVVCLYKGAPQSAQAILEGQCEPIPDPATRAGRARRQRRYEGPFPTDADLRMYVQLLTVEDPNFTSNRAFRWWLP